MTSAVRLARPLSPSKILHIGLWVVQVLLGAAFLMAGFMKGTTPLDELAKTMTWVAAVPGGLVRFIALSEVLGGLGLILPAATRIKPLLTPLAAAGLTTIMALAVVTHLWLGEAAHVIPSVVLGALTAFVAWGRFKKAPITPRA